MFFEDKSGGDTEKYEYLYEHGITDYVNELVGDKGLTPVHFCSGSATGRDRADQPDYQVKMNVAFAFSNTVQALEYYHNSSWLEHGGSPDRAVPPGLRQPGQRLAEIQRPVQKERKCDHFCRRAGLPGAGFVQLLHP